MLVLIPVKIVLKMEPVDVDALATILMDIAELSSDKVEVLVLQEFYTKRFELLMRPCKRSLKLKPSEAVSLCKVFSSNREYLLSIEPDRDPLLLACMIGMEEQIKRQLPNINA